MASPCISLLTKITAAASASQRCFLGVNVNRDSVKYYSAKKSETKAEVKRKSDKTIKHCKQFTTISKILDGRTNVLFGSPSNKISVIGLEAIGIATVNAILNQYVSDNVCIVDLDDEVLNGELIDLKMGALHNGNANIIASKDLAATAGSKICIVFTGTYKQLDEHPSIYAKRSVGIMTAIIPPLAKYSPNMIIIVASKPVDILSYAAWKLSGLPKRNIIGIGTMVDTARFRCILSQRSGISPKDCRGYIIGEQGANSVPVWSGVTIAGVPIKSINSKIGTKNDAEDWNEIYKQAVTCDDVVEKLKGYNSWTYGLCIANLCRVILKNLNTVLPVSTYVKGKHGICEDVFLSLPCVIGANGVTNIIRGTLTSEEEYQLQRCAENVVSLQNTIQITP